MRPTFFAGFCKHLKNASTLFFTRELSRFHCNGCFQERNLLGGKNAILNAPGQQCLPVFNTIFCHLNHGRCAVFLFLLLTGVFLCCCFFLYADQFFFKFGSKWNSNSPGLFPTRLSLCPFCYVLHLSVRGYQMIIHRFCNSLQFNFCCMGYRLLIPNGFEIKCVARTFFSNPME